MSIQERINMVRNKLRTILGRSKAMDNNPMYAELHDLIEVVNSLLYIVEDIHKDSRY